MMLQKSAQMLLQKSVQMLRAKPEETSLQNSVVQTVDTDTVWHSAGHQLGEPATGFASPVEERASMAAATRHVFKDMSLSYIVK
jgi:hypothetical protein